ncbi:hypothetical protein ATO13_21131 [Stappia sp. 22II-S9-Z10]|nr:hypothetical protein ATO13_21131 [Stappia sp. 22II-S9-Z10]
MITIYVDDFVITAPTREEVELAFGTLRDAFERHPAGAFTFGNAKPELIARGFTYLGYQISLTSDGKVAVSVPERTELAFTEKMFGFLEEIDSGKDRYAEFSRWFKSSIRAFSEEDAGFTGRLTEDLLLMAEIYSWDSCPEIVFALESLTPKTR